MSIIQFLIKITSFIFFMLLIAVPIVNGQCPGTSCTYTITGADASDYNVNTGEKICLEAGADFTGQIGLFGGEIQNCATNPQSFSYFINSASPSSTFNNYGTYQITGNPALQDGLVINNFGTFFVFNLSVNGGAAEFNNFGMTIVGNNLYVAPNGTLLNSGTIQVVSVFNVDDNTTFDHTGDITANRIIFSGSWTSSGNFAANTNFSVESSSIANLSGGEIIANDFFNNGTTDGLSCVSITISNTTNNSGILTGNIGFVDLTPPSSAPFIDVNSGTVGSGVIWTTCPGGAIEEICNNNTDDNGDGRIDETYPGGVQTDMQLWLKANVGTNTTTNGSDVTSWSDESVNGYSANADSNATDWPIFTETAINYNPGIDFDGDYTDDFSDGLHLGADYIFADKEGLHVFIVCDPNVDAETNNHVFDFGLAANGGYGMIYSDNNYGMYTNNLFGGTNTELFHSEGDEPALIEFEVNFNDFQSFFRNGTELAAIPVTIAELTASQVNEDSTYQTGATNIRGPVSIGRKSASVFLNNNGGRIFDGNISEVIVYNDSLSTLDKEKINSYLAVKYGITLNHNYLSSTETVKKDINDGYANTIAGIGRDDCAGLYQKQSKSVEPEAVVAAGTGSIATSNQTNTGTILSDEAFLMWGNDGVAENTSWNNATVNIPGFDYSRVDRVWRFTESLDITNVAIQITLDNPLYSFPAIPGTADGFYYLLTDDDGDFTNGGTTEIQMTTLSSSLAEAIIADPASGYFSFGVREAICSAQAPTLSK